MDYAKLAREFENEESSTPEEHIRKMFRHTDAEGNLCTSGRYYGVPIDEKGMAYVLRMDWDSEDCDRAVREFQKLDDAISIIGNTAREKGISVSEAGKDLPEEIKPYWDIYVKPYDLSGVDTDVIGDIYHKIYMESPLTDEEDRLRLEYVAAKDREAESRLGRRTEAAYLIGRATRVAKCVCLGAPAVITDNERKFMAGALAVNMFATAVEKTGISWNDGETCDTGK